MNDRSRTNRKSPTNESRHGCPPSLCDLGIETTMSTGNDSQGRGARSSPFSQRARN